MVFEKLFGKKKQKEEPEAEKTGKAPIKEESILKRTCRELGREDLYEPLSNLLLIDPRQLAKDFSANPNMRLDAINLASVLLYRKEYDGAKSKFQEAYERWPYRREYVKCVLENFDDTVKIAEKTWEIDGVYKAIEERKITAFRSGP